MLGRQSFAAAASTVGLFLLCTSPLTAQSTGSSDPPNALEIATRADTGLARFDPAVAGAMSALLPGAGQFYNRQNTKGALMIAGMATSLIVAFTAGISEREFCSGDDPFASACVTQPYWPNSRFWLGLGAAAGIQVWSILDAIAVANRMSTEDGDGQPGARLEIGPRMQNGGPELAAALRILLRSPRNRG